MVKSATRVDTRFYLFILFLYSTMKILQLCRTIKTIRHFRIVGKVLLAGTVFSDRTHPYFWHESIMYFDSNANGIFNLSCRCCSNSSYISSSIYISTNRLFQLNNVYGFRLEITSTRHHTNIKYNVCMFVFCAFLGYSLDYYETLRSCYLQSREGFFSVLSTYDVARWLLFLNATGFWSCFSSQITV